MKDKLLRHEEGGREGTEGRVGGEGRKGKDRGDEMEGRSAKNCEEREEYNALAEED